MTYVLIAQEHELNQLMQDSTTSRLGMADKDSIQGFNKQMDDKFKELDKLKVELFGGESKYKKQVKDLSQLNVKGIKRVIKK